ncbi:hypothetical protein M0R72_08830 [Candidatus Pacearchaeota archaeon]|jgi:hypothetical protein|nr:hypothetical protein [Candidatus Pacearchaeota archaeon]
MPYIENPKTKGSGIVCCIPQKGHCPNKCPECFFQNGRSYLEPLADNLPSMPDPVRVAALGQVVRVNDGNDSNVEKDVVLAATECYRHKFYNTAIPNLDFPACIGRSWHGMGDVTEEFAQAPVVLTINPGRMCDERFYRIEDCYLSPDSRRGAPPRNLMFVRLLVSPTNGVLAHQAIDHWTKQDVPVVLTFMAYHQEPRIKTIRCGTPCDEAAPGWVARRRTTNTYWAVDGETWASIMHAYRKNPLVYSCGEGLGGSIKCRQCGNCLREYFATKERMKGL